MELTRFLDHPVIEPSTNWAENSMRPIAIGRHNWLHLGSKEAGPKIAAIFSIVESCRKLGVPIRQYLADALPGLAVRSIQDLAGLTPTAYAVNMAKQPTHSPPSPSTMALPERLRLFAQEPVPVAIPNGRGRYVCVNRIRSATVPSQQLDFAVPVTLWIRFVVSQPSGNSLKGWPAFVLPIIPHVTGTQGCAKGVPACQRA